MKNLCISFSGGETSAYMTYRLLNCPKIRENYANIIVIFANTGQENEKTLDFVRQCDEHLGFNTVWIEAVTNHGERKSPAHKIVTFETAARNGEPFEDAIRKYGIPNSKFKHCSRSLKYYPINHYLRSIGWAPHTYDMAIGIRVDEIDRISVQAKARDIVYPLISTFPMTKPQINQWWQGQEFRLGITGYQGNCKWCWKKSFRKHLTIMSETPEAYDFPERMEAQYGQIGAEFAKEEREGYSRTFFRGNVSTAELRRMYEEKRNSFSPAPDENMIMPDFDPALDLGGGCEESCEVYSDEDSGPE